MAGTENGQAKDDETVNSCQYCSQGCRDEFQCSNWSLEHETPDLFVYPQWTVRPSILFVIYRLVTSLYFLSVFIYSLVVYKFTPHWKYITLLTHWSFIVLVCTELLKTVTVIVGYIHGRKKPNDEPVHTKMSPLFKITWLADNVSSTAALVIAILYWAVVYKGWALDIQNVTTHAVNAVYVVVDHFISGIPKRFYHFYQPVAYGVTYGLFTVIYWAAGGTDERNQQRYIYSVLNYGPSPGTSVGWLFAVFAFTFIVHLILFGMTKLRQFIYVKCCSRQVISPDIEIA